MLRQALTPVQRNEYNTCCHNVSALSITRRVVLYPTIISNLLSALVYLNSVSGACQRNFSAGRTPPAIEAGPDTIRPSILQGKFVEAKVGLFGVGPDIFLDSNQLTAVSWNPSQAIRKKS
jgi:hypothetical protein